MLLCGIALNFGSIIITTQDVGGVAIARLSMLRHRRHVKSASWVGRECASVRAISGHVRRLVARSSMQRYAIIFYYFIIIFANFENLIILSMQ